jgi:hypothetical protein
MAMTICSGPSLIKGLDLETEYTRQSGSMSLTRLANSDASAMACDVWVKLKVLCWGNGGRESLGAEGTFEEDMIREMGRETYIVDFAGLGSQCDDSSCEACVHDCEYGTWSSCFLFVVGLVDYLMELLVGRYCILIAKILNLAGEKKRSSQSYNLY